MAFIDCNVRYLNIGEVCLQSSFRGCHPGLCLGKLALLCLQRCNLLLQAAVVRRRSLLRRMGIDVYTKA